MTFKNDYHTHCPSRSQTMTVCFGDFFPYFTYFLWGFSAGDSHRLFGSVCVWLAPRTVSDKRKQFVDFYGDVFFMWLGFFFHALHTDTCLIALHICFALLFLPTVCAFGLFHGNCKTGKTFPGKCSNAKYLQIFWAYVSSN